jgi:hypothetical protein
MKSKEIAPLNKHKANILRVYELEQRVDLLVNELKQTRIATLKEVLGLLKSSKEKHLQYLIQAGMKYNSISDFDEDDLLGAYCFFEKNLKAKIKEVEK